jgi:hypothetical protein
MGRAVTAAAAAALFKNCRLVNICFFILLLQTDDRAKKGGDREVYSSIPHRYSLNKRVGCSENTQSVEFACAAYNAKTMP